MKSAICTYIVFQAALLAVWLTGIFDMPALFAFMPTFGVLALLLVVVSILKLIGCFMGIDDDDDDELAGIFGVSQEEDDGQKEDSENGQSQGQED